VDAAFVQFFEKTVKPAVIGSGATVLAYFVAEQSENTFPALPVREGENVFVWFARFNDRAAYNVTLLLWPGPRVGATKFRRNSRDA
jgi:hypothetical protein